MQSVQSSWYVVPDTPARRLLTLAQSEVVSHTYWDTMFYFLISKCRSHPQTRSTRRSPRTASRLRELHTRDVRPFSDANELMLLLSAPRLNAREKLRGATQYNISDQSVRLDAVGHSSSTPSRERKPVVYLLFVPHHLC